MRLTGKISACAPPVLNSRVRVRVKDMVSFGIICGNLSRLSIINFYNIKLTLNMFEEINNNHGGSHLEYKCITIG